MFHLSRDFLKIILILTLCVYHDLYGVYREREWNREREREREREGDVKYLMENRMTVNLKYVVGAVSKK